MVCDAGDLSIQAELNRTKLWITIPLMVGDQTVDMVLDTGSPLSSISQGTFNRLMEAVGIRQVSRRLYLLADLRIQGQPIPDLAVRISPRVTSVGAHGILGLDFLGRYETIEFHVPTMRLTLRTP